MFITVLLIFLSIYLTKKIFDKVLLKRIKAFSFIEKFGYALAFAFLAWIFAIIFVVVEIFVIAMIIETSESWYINIEEISMHIALLLWAPIICCFSIFRKANHFNKILAT